VIVNYDFFAVESFFAAAFLLDFLCGLAVALVADASADFAAFVATLASVFAVVAALSAVFAAVVAFTAALSAVLADVAAAAVAFLVVSFLAADCAWSWAPANSSAAAARREMRFMVNPPEGWGLYQLALVDRERAAL
jgi:hypothetical protein